MIIAPSSFSIHTFLYQGRTKPFHGGGLSKNVGHHGWPMTKNKKKHTG